MSTLYVREVAKAPDRVREFAGQLFGARLVLMAGIAVCVGLVVWGLDRPPEVRWTMALVSLGLIGNASTMDWVYQGTQRMGRLAVRNVAVAVITYAVARLLVHTEADLLWAAGVTAGSVVLMNVSVLGPFLREYGGVRPCLARSSWARLLRSAAPIGAALFLMQIYATVDQLMLGVLRTDEEVGWYASAFRVLSAVLVVDQVLQQAFLPALADAPPEKAEGRELSRRYATTLSLLGLPLAAGGAVFADEILVLFAGQEYAPGGTALAILLSYAALLFLSKPLGDSLMAWDRERDFLRAVAAAALVNVVLNLALIPTWGALGAAAATLASGTAAAVGMALPYWRLVGTLHSGAFGRIIVATAFGALLPALGVRLAGGSVWIGIVVAVPAYLIAAVAAGAVPPEVLHLIKRRVGQAPLL